MRGNLLNATTTSYIIAVEYIIQESGAYYEGGQYDWEGSFVPSLPLTLGASSYILEQEDGRRGLIRIVRQRPIPEQPPICFFSGHAGLDD